MVSSTYALMWLQVTPYTEKFITHFTPTWLFPRMYDMMSHQTTLLIEYVASVTCMWTILSTYALMCLYITLLIA